MATIEEQRVSAITNARTFREDINAQLAAASLSVDLVAVIVPVQYAIGVQANPSSAKTIEELRTLAAASGFDLYEPS